MGHACCCGFVVVIQSLWVGCRTAWRSLGGPVAMVWSLSVGRYGSDALGRLLQVARCEWVTVGRSL